jgi:hypothetical protein
MRSMSGISLSQYVLKSRSTNNDAARYVIIFVPMLNPSCLIPPIVLRKIIDELEGIWKERVLD